MTPQQLVERLRSQPKPGPAITFAQRRTSMEAMTARAPLPDGTTVRVIDASGVPGEWIEAAGSTVSAGPVTLYLHGGGYTIGSCATHRALAANLSVATGGPVVTVDYRLAPEHPFPAAVEDAVAAWRWLLVQGGVDTARSAIGGDSAGGGLAAATLLALRTSGEALPAAGILLSPWVDFTLAGATHQTMAHLDPMVDATALDEGVHAYGAGADPTNPLLSPVLGDWTGLPPLLIQVGEFEVLLDDARTLAKVAGAAGVDVTLEEWPAMVHVWQSFCGLIEDADRAVVRLGEFVRTHAG